MKDKEEHRIGYLIANRENNHPNNAVRTHSVGGPPVPTRTK